MKPEELASEADGLLRVVNGLGRGAAMVADSKAAEIEVTWFGQTLVEDSADAAVRFAKMAVRRRYGDCTGSEDLNELADTLESHDVEREWEGLTMLIRGINGDAHLARSATLTSSRIQVENVSHAGRRVSILVPALFVEFDHVTLTPDLARAAKAVLAELRRVGLRTVDRFPVTLRPVPDGFGEVATAVCDVLPSIRLAYETIAFAQPGLTHRSRQERSPWSP